MIARLQESFPLATFRADGNAVVMIAQPEQITQASRLIETYAAEIERNRPVSDVVMVQNASAADMEKLVGAVIPALRLASSSAGEGKVGGAVAMTGTASDVERAKSLVQRLDAETAVGSNMTYRVYELKYTSAPAVADFLKKAAPEVEAIAGPETYSPERGNFSPLGSALRSASGSGSESGSGQNSQNNQQNQSTSTGGQGQTKMKEGDRATVVVLKGTARAVDAAAKLVDGIDVKPVQIMVEVRVMETSPSFTEDLGLTYSWNPLQFGEVAPGRTLPGEGSRTRPAGIGQFSRLPFAFDAKINAMIRKGEAKMLANPSVRVISNNDANVFIGDTLRARVSQANGLGGQTVDVIEFPVGIILLIHPRANADGNITMHINPVVSTITAVGADNIPQTSSREAETTVMVKDGETIVLGGLIQDQYSRYIDEVPILSKIPIIGELFKNRSTTHRRTEVVVTITPHIVNEMGDKKP
jgi:type II secretory pathway component GspD/PulD (secretin)